MDWSNSVAATGNHPYYTDTTSVDTWTGTFTTPTTFPNFSQDLQMLQKRVQLLERNFLIVAKLMQGLGNLECPTDGCGECVSCTMEEVQREAGKLLLNALTGD